MIRAVIADDEAAARKRMRTLLDDRPDVEIVAAASDGIEALNAIALHNPDVAILDIEMPELSGLEVAKTLGPRAPALIFATAYDEHAIAAFEAAAIDYLLKPVSAARLWQSLQRVRDRRGKRDSLSIAAGDGERSQRLAVRIGNKYRVFPCAAVSAIVAQDHYSAIICGDDELYSEEPLDAILARLDSKDFLRVHRSAVINLHFVRELERLGDRKYEAILDDKQKTRVPISRQRLTELKAHLGIV